VSQRDTVTDAVTSNATALVVQERHADHMATSNDDEADEAAIDAIRAPAGVGTSAFSTEATGGDVMVVWRTRRRRRRMSSSSGIHPCHASSESAR